MGPIAPHSGRRPGARATGPTRTARGQAQENQIPTPAGSASPVPRSPEAKHPYKKCSPAQARPYVSAIHPAGLTAGSRWSARVKGADHRVNAHKALHPEWVPEPSPACLGSSLEMGWFYLRTRGSGFPPGCKHLCLACPVVVSPAAPKRPPATGCQPYRVGLVTRKVWGNLTDARAGTH